MSIEKAITDLTAAVNNLTALLSQTTGAPAVLPTPAAPTPAPAPAAPAAPPAAPAADPFGGGEPAADTGGTATAPGASVEDVRAVIGALASKDHGAAVALLAEFGAAKASELKPENYGAFVAGGQKKLAELAAA